MEEQPIINNTVQQSNIPTSLQPKHRSFLTSKLFLITLAIVVLFTVVLYLGSQLDLISKFTQTTSFSETSVKEGVPTANWKSYTDNNYHFSIKYPSKYKITPSKISGNNFKNPATLIGDLRIDIFQDANPKSLSVKDWMDEKNSAWKKEFQKCTQDVNAVNCGEGGPPKVLAEKEIKVDNIASLYQETEGDPVGRSTQVYVPHDKVIMVFSMFVVDKKNPALPVDSDSQGEFEQILSTFKFTDEKDQVVCAQDAKLCPDGSYVSRQGPNCEFAQCPQK